MFAEFIGTGGTINDTIKNLEVDEAAIATHRYDDVSGRQ